MGENSPVQGEKHEKSESLRENSPRMHLLLKNGLGTIFYVD
jgi:hypothetical protein